MSKVTYDMVNGHISRTIAIRVVSAMVVLCHENGGKEGAVG